VKDCNQCGKCCLQYGATGLSVSSEQLQYWQSFRPDIYRFVQNGDIWVDPETGLKVERCPWLSNKPNQQKLTCGIYEDRPDDCRYYPSTVQ